jgi:phosphatidylserine/phosphatidylglycerophosphate/cardiolipin synthase-like enzyme
MFSRIILCLALVAPIGCAVQQPEEVGTRQIEIAFSPEAGAEALVLKIISSARQSIRLAGYSFTSPAVVRSLMDAKRRGVDVKILLDDKGNRGQATRGCRDL